MTTPFLIILSILFAIFAFRACLPVFRVAVMGRRSLINYTKQDNKQGIIFGCFMNNPFAYVEEVSGKLLL